MLITFAAVSIGLGLLWFAQRWLSDRVAKQDMAAYYRSPAWAQKRIAAYRAHGRHCAVCGSKTDLQVHHLRYRKYGLPIFGREDAQKDLRVLCERHHPRGRYSLLEISARRLFYRMFHR